MAIRGGSWNIGGFRLPEFGITERIQNIVAPRVPQTSQGGSNLSAVFSSRAAAPTPLVSPRPSSGPVGQNVPRQVAPVTPRQSFTQQSPAAPSQQTQQAANVQDVSQYFEPQQEYQEPEVDISQDLRLAEETVASGIADYEASLAGIDTRTAQGKADLEGQKQYQATETGRIKGEATGSTESAINESRQAAAELQQGIAARYGASSSTGLGASAILGQQVIRSIGEARTKLSQTVGFLDQKQKDLEYQTFRAEQIVNSKADELKAQARQELQQAQLAAQNLRAGASRFKQSLVSEAIQRYRDTVNQINSRNTAFKQTLYLKQQEQQAEIDRIRENAKTKSTEMADANSKYVTDLYKSMAEKGQLSTQGFNQFEERVNVPQGTFIPKKEDEDPFDALRNLKKIGAGNV